jgi:hypothetical protein
MTRSPTATLATSPRHETVCLSEEESGRGDVHTKTVESVWSLLKRGVIGTYHQISMSIWTPIWMSLSIGLKSG